MSSLRGIETARPGDVERFSKTISESDIYLFAGICGDLHPVHVDEEYARRSGQRGRIAHGVLVLSLMSTAGTLMDARYDVPTVSYGYDRVRFVKPVHVGDTITAEYAIAEVEAERRRTIADCTCTNQHGDVVAVARHINQFLG